MRSPLRALAALMLLLPPAPAAAQGFFDSDSVMALTIRANLRTLLRDRNPDTNLWRDAVVSWRQADTTASARMRLRTRGLYRLRQCAFPPIRLRFAGDDTRGTPLADLRRPKLVTHCEDNAEYEQNLLQEYAIYRVLNLFTPASFRARLVRVTYEDSSGSRRPVTRYGIITEDPDRLASRLGGTLVETQGVTFVQTNTGSAALTGVFQYFIANTDWSLPFLHNIALLRLPDGIHLLSYDFDWAGVIDARYARPAPQLPIRSVRERVYRGHCQNAATLEPVLLRFEALKDSIYEIYRSVPGLDPGTVQRTLRYYDDFYHTIADRARFEQRVVRGDCLR